MTSIRKKEWFDNEAFWRELYPYMFPEERFAQTAEQMQKALALANPAGKTALDLCCGPGRCSIALAQLGFTMTGVDKTKFLLDRAKSNAEIAGAKIEWIEMDMRDFVRPETYDLVLSMFTSFGYFDDKSEDLAVLRNIVASLKPGGVFLIDIIGKEILARVYQSAMTSVLPDGMRVIQCHEAFDNWTRIANEWIVVRDERVQTFKFHHTIYSGQELIDRMLLAGFASVTLYGSLNGDAYGPNAKRLIALAKK